MLKISFQKYVTLLLINFRSPRRARHPASPGYPACHGTLSEKRLSIHRRTRASVAAAKTFNLTNRIRLMIRIVLSYPCVIWITGRRLFYSTHFEASERMTLPSSKSCGNIEQLDSRYFFKHKNCPNQEAGPWIAVTSELKIWILQIMNFSNKTNEKTTKQQSIHEGSSNNTRN